MVGYRSVVSVIKHLCGVVLGVSNIGCNGLLLIEKRDGVSSVLITALTVCFTMDDTHPSIGREI